MIDFIYKHPDGSKERVRRLAKSMNMREARREERELERELDAGWFGRKEVPTFGEWFNGRFWKEWVVGRKNKPSEKESKRSIYKCHLKEYFGHLRLNEIANGNYISDFRAGLVEKEEKGDISLKRVNNILAVLSKALRYAEDVGMIEHAPRVGIFTVERPEIEWWEFEEYKRLLNAAKTEDPFWYAAVCLAGEAGLRIGEIRALIWERDIDLVAGTITINEQTRKGITGTPKGRTRRKVPITTTLQKALKKMSVLRRGYVVRNDDGTQLRDGQTTHAIYRLCRLAGLPERAWHCLRHSFGTHAALFGVNPWRLMAWMGHKRIDETMRYVHVAGDHMRPLPPNVLKAAQNEDDPDKRIVLMLGARTGVYGKNTAKPSRPIVENTRTLPC